MHLALVKPILWIVASMALVGSTVGGVVSALNSGARPTQATTSTVPLYGK
jgi:hypothetical protein